MSMLTSMIAARTTAPLLLAFLSFAGCATETHSGMTDTARPNEALTGTAQYPVGHEDEPGIAKMVCTITPTGSTEACRCVTSTSGLFCKARLDFAAHAHFLPAMRNGVPIAEPDHTLTVNFKPAPVENIKPIILDHQSIPMDFSTLPDAEVKARTHGNHWPLNVDVMVHCMVLQNGLAKDCTAHSDWPTMTSLMLRFITLAHYTPATPNGTPIAAPWDTTLHIHIAPDETPSHSKPRLTQPR